MNTSLEKKARALVSTWQSKLPHLFLKTLNEAPRILHDKLLDIARVELPAEFFRFVGWISGKKKKGTIAQGFKSRIMKGQIEPAVSITSYLEKLYRAPDETWLTTPRQGPLKSYETQINEEEVKAAIEDLKLKATGIDGMTARILKSKELQPVLIEKLKTVAGH